MQKIQTTENKILRMCTYSDPMERTAEIHAKSKLEPIEERLKLKHFNFIINRIERKENMLLVQHIAQQAKTDREYTSEISKLKQKRKNLLDDFRQTHEVLFQELFYSQPS
jgi:hypothetical protein